MILSSRTEYGQRLFFENSRDSEMNLTEVRVKEVWGGE